ncbi:MAG: OmpA family protein [Rhodospirillales bacterium]|nr:OmpA family protein [Rhodospirillales bacterium]
MNSKLKNILVAAAASFALSACAGLELGKVKSVQPSSTPFNNSLYKEYIALSQSEYDEADWWDSDTFAMRANAAAAGNAPDPEAISARNLPEEKVGELTSARERLVGALTHGAERTMPEQAARAQAMFDCWMQEQEENFQPKDIAFCRSGFLAAMAELEKKPMAMPAPLPMPPVPGPFMVYFDFDRAHLTAEARATIKQAADDFKNSKSKTIRLSGHTDRAGANAYNTQLSQRRVSTVANALISSGVPSTAILQSHHGEDRQRIVTNDGVREKENRRVEISLRR